MEIIEALTIVTRLSDALKVVKEQADLANSRNTIIKDDNERHRTQIEELNTKVKEQTQKVKLWNTVSNELNLTICEDCNGVGEDIVCHADDYGNGGCERFFCNKCKGKGYIKLNKNK